METSTGGAQPQKPPAAQRWRRGGDRPPPARPRLHGDRQRRHLAADHHLLNFSIPFSSSKESFVMKEDEVLHKIGPKSFSGLSRS